MKKFLFAPQNGGISGKNRLVRPEQANNAVIKGTAAPKYKKVLFRLAALAVVCVLFTVPAFADSGIDSTLKNFGEIMFSIVRIAGVIATLWGLIQFGIAVRSHDGAQKAQGLLEIVGGLLFVFAKEILTAVGVTL